MPATAAPAASVTPVGPHGAVKPATDAHKVAAEGASDVLELMRRHPDLAAAMLYLDKEPNQMGYYKVGEAILRALDKPKNRETFGKLGWASDDEVWRFTESTQTKRHHGLAGPDKPMNDDEVRSLVSGLLNKLIAHLATSAR